jgi:putative ATP-binding cassette transporter
LLSKRHEKAYDDTAIIEVLNLVGLGDILSRSGGLDIEQEWDSLLSPHEQRQVSFARILISEPQIVVMANPCRDLGPETRRRLFEILSMRDMTLIIMGSRDTFLKEGEGAIPFDRVLDLSSSGSWTFEAPTHRSS